MWNLTLTNIKITYKYRKKSNKYVKTRTNLKYGNPVDAVDKNKTKHIWNAAKFYLYKNNLEKEYVRFDVIEVYIIAKGYRINHIKNVMM